jgi:hypothetical protein
LSIDINPADRAAIDLRTDIAAGVRHGAHTLNGQQALYGTPTPYGEVPGQAAMPPAIMPPAIYDWPPVFRGEQPLEGSPPRPLPPMPEQAPSSEDLPPPRPSGNVGMSEPTPLNAPSTASSRAQTGRRVVFPVRPGRKR